MQNYKSNFKKDGTVPFIVFPMIFVRNWKLEIGLLSLSLISNFNPQSFKQK
ncbi:MAG: hypothetical protein AB1422_06125 [bacterium]